MKLQVTPTSNRCVNNSNPHDPEKRRNPEGGETNSKMWTHHIDNPMRRKRGNSANRSENDQRMNGKGS